MIDGLMKGGGENCMSSLHQSYTHTQNPLSSLEESLYVNMIVQYISQTEIDSLTA